MAKQANITAIFGLHRYECIVTCCQQHPEWSVLRQVGCFSPRQPTEDDVVLHHPGHPWLLQQSLPDHRSQRQMKNVLTDGQ